MKSLKTPHFTIGPDQPLTIISGPCVIESLDLALQAAEFLSELQEAYPVQIVYKSSFDKANRSNIHSYRGPGIEEGLKILDEVKTQFPLSVFTDIHEKDEAKEAAEVCDFLQIPAFLCRQTDLLIAAAKTGKIISIKKGQFMAPWDMENTVGKLVDSGNDRLILTERGFSFGYNNLVSDMRAIPIMKQLGHLVCFDATHSVQLPGGESKISGGQREFIPTLAKSAIAAGADLLYMETHPNPEDALCDSKSQIAFEDLKAILPKLIDLYQLMEEERSC